MQVVKNNNVVVKDELADTLDFKGNVTLDKQGFKDYVAEGEGDRELTFKLGDMKPGESKTLIFDVQVNDSAYKQKIENIAEAAADNADTASDAADAVEVANGKADVSITKKADVTKAKVGDTVRYTIHASNAEDAEVAAEDVHVVDELPETLEFKEAYINGDRANVNFDPRTNTVDVTVGGLSVGEEKNIVIETIVNAKAYGKNIDNVATITSSNATSDEAEAIKPVKVEKGHAKGHAASKVPSTTSVKPGDTMSYSITIYNEESASADWEGAKIVDQLPEGMDFLNGSVTANGRTTNEYSYNARNGVLTIMPDAIAPGEKVVYKFDVKIAETFEGATLSNTAALIDPEDPDTEIPVPSSSVEVQQGNPHPVITVDQDKTTAKDLEQVNYTVTVSNSTKDGNTSTWKNARLTWTIPSVTNKADEIYIDGEADNMYVREGNVFTVPLGDLKPGESRTVKYTLEVRQGTQVQLDGSPDSYTAREKENNTIKFHNEYEANGANGNSVKATDKDVSVPPLYTYKGNSGNKGDSGNTGGNTDTPVTPDPKPGKELTGMLQGSKVPEKKSVDASQRVNDHHLVDNIYTITVLNDSNSVAKNVVVKDDIDTTRVHFYIDEVTVDGKGWKVNNHTSGNGGDQYFEYQSSKEKGSTDTVIFHLANLQPNEARTIKFNVRMENDNAGNPYINTAILSSGNVNVAENGKLVADPVMVNNPGTFTGDHYKLVAGYDSGNWAGMWVPYTDFANKYYLSTEEASSIILRSLTNEKRKAMLGGKSVESAMASLPADWPAQNSYNKWYYTALCYMGAAGGLSGRDVNYDLAEEGKDYYKVNATPRMIATGKQVNKMLTVAGLLKEKPERATKYQNANPDPWIGRYDFVVDVMAMSGRDQWSDQKTHADKIQNKQWNDINDATMQNAINEAGSYHHYVLSFDANANQGAGDRVREMWLWNDLNRGTLI